ncbi:Mitochondrial adenine nucleotide transporter adnt1 [Datura stramonium]|uniref:Mitochondrial adenine nucleotide transporter adnt1 n=1 Tax=Datura stramonium TaxID=4076 RepID=A0ABS8RV70_DATST|nr:Mitochondrial adenine nucleotide transporter adnt1 [Datura stramonium]
MASEDVKAARDSAVEKIVNLAEEAKLAREEIKPTSHAVLSICKSLVAGGVAGERPSSPSCRSRTAVAPLERLKILLQVQNPHNIKYNGTIQGLKYIWRTEGFKGLFKGNGTNCARIIPNSAVKFFSYEQASKGILYLYREQTGNEDAQLTPLLRLGAGACAGIIAMSATYPMDMVRGRLTVQTESPYQYRGMFHALSTVLRGRSRALYKGWTPSVIGVIHISELNFAVYESLKDWLVKAKPFGLVDDSELGVTRLAWSCCRNSWTSDLPTLLMSFAEMQMACKYEGVRALYKGLVPNSVKVVPSISIAFVAYEQVKDLLELRSEYLTNEESSLRCALCSNDAKDGSANSI